MNATKYDTTTRTYGSRRSMERGIKGMVKRGWAAQSVVVVDPGYSCLKTVLLFWILWPLALLGKKPQKFTVIYVRPRPV